MAFFTQDFIDFFSNLEKNNNRDFFHANTKVYEKAVKKPFIDFVSQLMQEIVKFDKEINLDPKQAIFRIHKDIRFSKDKTPYKTFTSAVISAGGKKIGPEPGYYFELNHEHINLYGGLYQLEKESLESVRYYIMDHHKEFRSIIESDEFINSFGMILGEKNKKVNANFKEFVEIEPLLLNKQFYYSRSLDHKLILKDDLIDQMLAIYKNSYPMKEFLKKAIHYQD